jgi:hypothetical protein
MKTPRLDDFAPTNTRSVKELHSPLDDMPRIEKPHQNHSSDEQRKPSSTPVETHSPQPTKKRPYLRRTFDFYEDQITYLTKASLEERLVGRDGSMNAMIREAIDDWIKRRTPAE